MYDGLFEVWRLEVQNSELQRLPSNFYPSIVDYLRRLREEGRMLDKKTIKANLLKKELINVKRMVSEIIQLRYKKVVDLLAKGEKFPLGALTAEEEKIYGGVAPFADDVKKFVESILHGSLPKTGVETKHKRAVLRFLVDVPAIIGSDMKPYGPFKAEDVASLPMENANILVKQGLAERVELG